MQAPSASARELWGPDPAQSPGSALQDGFEKGRVLSCQVSGSQWIYLEPFQSPHTSNAPRRGKGLCVARRAEVQPCSWVGESRVMWKEEIHCVKQPGKPKENLLCEILKQNGDSVLKTLWVAAAVLIASAGHLTL